ncbi:hypothetical protein SAY87_002679 [Trapa incisa]|uniref:Class IV aminotransferase n=1 Tax=Trapa incisa TaxID=236973 RepID=A0AAN7JTI0_9MYRT|nr:hypothetical protein SAY87_002679 [Trapa incisa]
MDSTRFLFSNGIVHQVSDVPPVTSFLEAHPGVYTVTRTHNNASCLLLWERHLKRLANSLRIMFETNPKILFGPNWSTAHSSLLSSTQLPQFEPIIQCLVNESISKVSPYICKETKVGQEWSVAVLVCGNSEKFIEHASLDREKISRALDVHIHVSSHIPMVFGSSGASLALVGRGRTLATAKHLDWVRHRKTLEKLRAPSVTELLLSNDGDHILEGSVSNFFVVSRTDEKSTEANEDTYSSFEVQTAPLGDVLPGIIRQLVIEVCLSMGIPVREVAPSWSMRESWEEAFITSKLHGVECNSHHLTVLNSSILNCPGLLLLVASDSLRILQHVVSVRVPSSWDPSESRSWNEIEWEEKHLKDGPGMITMTIQAEVIRKASFEGYLLAS